MTNLDDDKAQVGILDGVKNAIVAMSDAVELVTGEFFGARGSGVRGELPDFRYDTVPFFWRDSFKLLDGRGLDLELIACHGVAGFSERSRNRDSAPWPEFGRQRDLRRLPLGFASRPC